NPKTGGPYWQGGTDQYGGYCAGNVEIALCQTEGGPWCKGANANSFANLANAAGWTSTTVQGSTNSILLPQLADGYLVQTPPVPGHQYGHVCIMEGGVCYSDTAQSNIVPYSSVRNSTQPIIIWKPGTPVALKSKKTVNLASVAASIQSHSGKVLAAS